MTRGNAEAWGELWGQENDYLVRLYGSLNLGGLAFAVNLAFGEKIHPWSGSDWFALMIGVVAFSVGVISSIFCSDARLDYYMARRLKAADDDREAAGERHADKAQRQVWRDQASRAKARADKLYRFGFGALGVGSLAIAVAALVRS